MVRGPGLCMIATRTCGTLYDKIVVSGIERSGSDELRTNIIGADIPVEHFNRGRASKL